MPTYSWSTKSFNLNLYYRIRIKCALRTLTASSTNTAPKQAPAVRPVSSYATGDVVSILCKNGRLKNAVSNLYHLNQVGTVNIYVSLLQTCTKMKALAEGKRVHAHMIKTGFETGIFVGTKLVIIRMQQAGMHPNGFTFTSVISACACIAVLEPGKQVHAYVIKAGIDSDVFVGSSLVTMYGTCGDIDNARQVFDTISERNVVSWNAMISGYAQNGRIEDAEELFDKMPERNVVSWTTMVAGYVQNGTVEIARHVFDKMSERSVVSWTAMIAGYAQNGHGEEALKLFYQMQSTGTKPNQSTFSSILNACAGCAALNQGKHVHVSIIKTGFQSDVVLWSALVDMYAKCGSIQEALHAFNKMPERNAVSWNAMITGYAQHGYGKEALQLFEQMQHRGIKPNSITFVGVLSACRHAGLVDEGWRYFSSMDQDHCIVPEAEHYACMVDLIGRAGHLDEAEAFINKMPFKPDVVVWGALLGACRIHVNMELGECAAEHLLELEPQNAAAYVLLSNIYAATGRWDDVVKVRKMMKDRGVKKRPGCSWIEVENREHAFVVADRSHPRTKEIYAALERLDLQMKAAGYVPDTNFVFHELEEEQREYLFSHHSEKLAIGVIKNLSICVIPIWRRRRNTSPATIGRTLIAFRHIRTPSGTYTAISFCISGFPLVNGWSNLSARRSASDQTGRILPGRWTSAWCSKFKEK
eukprot:Gb_35278 [translate_table: standard]